MNEAGFYSAADAFLGVHLGPARWERVDRGEYLRRESDGLSRLTLDPRKGLKQFAVMVGYDPQDMLDLAAELFAGEVDVDRQGFLCGPYLTPGGVSRARREWPCRTSSELDASLGRIARAIDDVAEPWLTSLRDPLTLARQADPVAALMCGFAWERAGDAGRAAERYREMWKRLEGALALASSSRLDVPASLKRQYVFVARRLECENELSARFADELAP